MCRSNVRERQQILKYFCVNIVFPQETKFWEALNRFFSYFQIEGDPETIDYLLLEFSKRF
jgi:hypothetical protein